MIWRLSLPTLWTAALFYLINARSIIGTSWNHDRLELSRVRSWRIWISAACILWSIDFALALRFPDHTGPGCVRLSVPRAEQTHKRKVRAESVRKEPHHKVWQDWVCLQRTQLGRRVVRAPKHRLVRSHISGRAELVLRARVCRARLSFPVAQTVQ